MRRSPVLYLVAGWVLLAAVNLHAQEIRGELVTDAGEAVGGAMIVLLGEDGEQLGGALTGSDGTYLVRAPAAGGYTLRAQRIGFESTTSPVLEVGDGQTVNHRMVASAAAVELDGFTVEGTRRCIIRPDEGLRIATLWEEARKALDAAAFARAEGLHRYRITRYRRVLDAETLRPRREETRSGTGYGQSPFVSVPTDDLLEHGFVQETDTGTVYHAPDADVLLSDAFLDSHCFRLSETAGESEGMLGLMFEPVRQRGPPGVRGTLWIDRRSAELRYLEYRYAGLTHLSGATRNIGGRVDFEVLPTGAWIVRRWSIRMPVVERRDVRWGDAGRQERAVLTALTEEGGEVVGIASASVDPMRRGDDAVVTGTVLDASREAPVAGATVYLSGSAHSTTTDADGRFRLDGLRAGEYAVGFFHPRYTSLGIHPEPVTVSLHSGDEEAVTLSVSRESYAAALTRACPREEFGPRSAAVTGVILDDATGEPVPDATVRLSWTRAAATAGRTTREERDHVEVSADTDGVYLACLPDGSAVTGRATLDTRTSAPFEFTVRGVSLEHRDLAVRTATTREMAALESCSAEQGRGESGILTGFVRDAGSGVPLPHADVTLSWRTFDMDDLATVLRQDGHSMTVSTDAGGAYVACGLPEDRAITARASLLANSSEETTLVVRAGGVAEQEFEVPIGLPMRVSGRLRDWASNHPIRDAIVRVPALGLEALSDRSGRFSFEEVPPGTHDLEIRHLAYGTRTEEIEVGGDGGGDYQIRLPTEAIGIEGFEVTVRSELEAERRARGTRMDVMTRRDIEPLEGVALHAGDLARRIPNVTSGDSSAGVCIEARRRQPSLGPGGPATCASVLVVVDGVTIANTGSGGRNDFLLSLPPSQIESIEFLGPIQAGARFGSRSGNGALLIYTRGNGPYVERR